MAQHGTVQLDLAVDEDMVEDPARVEAPCPVLGRRQLATDWCWAACVVAVTHRGRRAQRAVAERWLARSGTSCDDCYDDFLQRYPDGCCNRVVAPEDLVDLWKHNGVAGRDRAITSTVVVDIIAALRDAPVQVVLNGNHGVLIDAWEKGPFRTENFRIMDPEFGAPSLLKMTSVDSVQADITRLITGLAWEC